MSTSRHRSLALFAAFAVCLQAGAVSAEISLRIGVYDYDELSGAVWSCGGFTRGLESRMTADLEEDVTIRVALAEDYQEGVSAITNGAIDLARFPNVPTNWVVRPGFSPRVLEAWRKALVSMEFSDLGPSSARVASLGSTGIETYLEEVYGSCERGIRGLARSGRLRLDSPEIDYMPLEAFLSSGLADASGADGDLYDLINALPSTAAGIGPHALPDP